MKIIFYPIKLLKSGFVANVKTSWLWYVASHFVKFSLACHTKTPKSKNRHINRDQKLHREVIIQYESKVVLPFSGNTHKIFFRYINNFKILLGLMSLISLK